MRNAFVAAAVAALLASVLSTPAAAQNTIVGIRGSMFTINGHPAYSPAAGFPNADPNLMGTLLNVRAVQATFDDANYPQRGTGQKPYTSNTMGEVVFEYPGGTWDPERNTKDRHGRWPIKRVEFFIDGEPYSYSRNAPYRLGNREWWNPTELSAGKHTLRVVAYDMRGPRFSETCSIVEIPFTVQE